VILDVMHFVREEQPFWRELEDCLNPLERRLEHRMSLAEIHRFYYLYRRAASDLARLRTFAAEPDIQRYLEALVARAYAEIHETREAPHRLRPRAWFFEAFPRTFRRHYRAFLVALAAMWLGSVFGAGAVLLDPEAKEAVFPSQFGHLQEDPAKRVAREEHSAEDRLEGAKSSFAAALMTNNIRVSIFAMALGITWGLGTLVMMFYNGVILGGVAMDYMLAGQSTFLAGWLLPHGSIELPSVLIAGQAGLVLAGALIGWGGAQSFRERLRAAGPDLVTLIGGVMLLLVWAGIVEAFFSQYHAPVIPYALKIAFGGLQLVLLFAFLLGSGKTRGGSVARKAVLHD